MSLDLSKFSEAPKPRIQKWPSMSIRIDSPNGYLYLTILEDDSGRPCKIETIMGKTGTDLAAWARATDQLVNLLLDNGVGINEIVDRLSGIMVEKPKRLPSGIYVKSGPDGIAVAFMEYKREKYKEMKEKFSDEDWEDE